ncbi:hypothetical protein BDF14DRAFT_1838619 [Spinellus fusiger]|nr:hypothetical protein BDF14DRAFT_1838619 [Spinellus fusiger]
MYLDQNPLEKILQETKKNEKPEKTVGRLESNEASNEYQKQKAKDKRKLSSSWSTRKKEKYVSEALLKS